jgi:hypothetical protein
LRIRLPVGPLSWYGDGVIEALCPLTGGARVGTKSSIPSRERKVFSAQAMRSKVCWNYFVMDFPCDGY